MKLIAAVLLAGLCVPCQAEGMARAARLNLGAESLTVGQKAPAHEKYLDCASSAIQTVKRCELKGTWASFAKHFGLAVAKVTVNLHYKGDVVNMFVEYAPAIGFDRVFSEVKASLGPQTKIEAWSDGSRLFSDYIWIAQDAHAEVSVSKTVKGAAGSAVRVYVSSLAGNRPIHPDDLKP